jgi:uroporphyrinogen decarboxylase
MGKNVNEKLLNALQGKNFASPPVWLMRQAGRYMPQYQTIRKKHALKKMFFTPEIAAEVTKLPVDILGVDAAILFSDILVVVEALGRGLDYVDGKGPIIERVVGSSKDLAEFPSDAEVRAKLEPIAQTIRLLTPDLDVPLIGFAGGPLTVASYMIEGGSSKDFKRMRQWLYCDPEGFDQLMQRLTDVTIDYLTMQVEAGVQVIQIFESWAGILTPHHFSRYSLCYLEQIVEAMNKLSVPTILFCKGANSSIKEIVAAGPAGISVDWQCDLGEIRKVVPSNIALQGNLDPYALYARKEILEEEVDQILRAMRGDPAFIFNLGHGITPDAPVDNVRRVVDWVKESKYAVKLAK